MEKAWLDKCDKWLEEIQNHLRDELLPFWFTHGIDDEFDRIDLASGIWNNAIRVAQIGWRLQ